MGSPQPSTSGTNPQLSLADFTTVKMDTFGKETYNLLKYVHDQWTEDKKKAENDEESNRDPEDVLLKAQRYTGLHMNTLQILLHEELNIDTLPKIDRKCIHDELMKFYLKDKILPTSTELFNRLGGILPSYEDVRSFRKKLVKMGYMFKKKGNNFVVLENPSIRFERFLYLKKIIEHRQAKTPIYFVCEITISSVVTGLVPNAVNNNQSRFIVAVSSHRGIQCFQSVLSFGIEEFNSWVQRELIPNLVDNSVVVIDNSPYHFDTFCSTPDKYSPKSKMMDWLKYHQIPFDKEMSRVELYTLVKRCTDTRTKLYKVDIWLKQYGHQLLRLPDCINNLTPALYIRHFVINKYITMRKNNASEQFNVDFEDISDQDINEFSELLYKEEKRLYDMELKLDDILETLEARLTPELDTYFSSCSDSD